MEPTKPKGKFTFEVTEEMRRHPMPTISDREIHEMKNGAFCNGLAVAGAIIIVVTLIVLLLVGR